MKKTLIHLPQNKRNELKKVVSIIHKLCDDVEMIIRLITHGEYDATFITCY